MYHPNSFAVFIRDHARRTDTPAGDFIEDARGVIRRGVFPKASTWDAVEWHLIVHKACGGAFEAGRAVHRRYRAWLAARGLEAPIPEHAE